MRFNNKLYILGGFRINTAMTNQIWEFTPTTNVWVLKNAVLPVARGYIPASTIYGYINGYRIYTGGGSDWNGTTLVDTSDSFSYDPVADSITAIPNIPRVTGETAAVAWAVPKLAEVMFVMGGGRTPPNPSNEIDTYDPFTNSWSGPGFHFLAARRNFAVDGNGGCATFGSGYGQIWLAGGFASDGTPLSSMEIYCEPCATPTATATFTPTPTATHTPTPIATATDTPTATPIATSTATPTPTFPPPRSPTPTPRRPTPAPRPEPHTPTPTATGTPSPTPTPSATPRRGTPTPRPRATPSEHLSPPPPAATSVAADVASVAVTPRPRPIPVPRP